MTVRTNTTVYYKN